jgi:hypothetical protein
MSLWADLDTDQRLIFKNTVTAMSITRPTVFKFIPLRLRPEPRKREVMICRQQRATGHHDFAVIPGAILGSLP